MPIKDFFDAHGVQYTVKREGQAERTEIGLPNDGHINFLPVSDIKKGDILTNPCGDTYVIERTETQFIKHEPSFIKADYRKDSPDTQGSTVFNIQNATGSIIGNNNYATLNYNAQLDGLKAAVAADASPDKQDLEQIVALLEMIVNDRVAPSKGLFSKFSAVMERHSWLSGSVASTVLAWLLTKVP